MVSKFKLIWVVAFSFISGLTFTSCSIRSYSFNQQIKKNEKLLLDVSRIVYSIDSVGKNPDSLLISDPKYGELKSRLKFDYSRSSKYVLDSNNCKSVSFTRNGWLVTSKVLKVEVSIDNERECWNFVDLKSNKGVKVFNNKICTYRTDFYPL